MVTDIFREFPPTRPEFDPELQPILNAILEAAPEMSDASLSEAREVTIAMGASIDLSLGGQIDVREQSIPLHADSPDLTLLILSPTTGEGPWPCIYYVHPGGMVVGDRRTSIEIMLPHVINGAVVVSVEYRLAPEHPHPAPLEDVYGGLVWVAEQAVELSIDAEKIIIAGGSAGGGLAAGAALMARDLGTVRLAGQILLSPMLDDRLCTHSSQMLDGEGAWDRNANLYGWNALLGNSRGSADVSCYAAPARAENLSGLPRTYIDVGSGDGFRDEVTDYAARLSQAGVRVDFHVWGGGYHGFDMIPATTGIGRAAVNTRDDFISRALVGRV